MKKLILVFITISLLFLPFGQLTRFVVGDWPVFIFLFEPFVALLSLLLFSLIQKDDSLKHNSFAISVLLFLIWLGISYLISTFFYRTDQNVVAFLYYLRISMYFLLFLGLYTFFMRYKGLKKDIRKVIWLSSSFIVLFSLVQFFLYPNLGNLAYLGWDPHLDRLVGLFFDPPITVSVFAMLGIFAYLTIRKPLLKYIVFLCFLILSVLTYSRGGILALFVVMLLYFMKKVNTMVKWGTMVMLVLGSLLFILLPSAPNESLNLKRTTSIFTRLNDYNKAIKIWQKNPLLGIGYNHIRYEKDSYSEELITEKYNPSHASASFHSSFLIILVTGGVIGLLLFMNLLYRMMRLHEFAFYGVLFLGIISMTDNVFLHPIILLLFAILTATYTSYPSRNGQ